ncbi:MAG: phospholipid carrier-dependent glycosyltransferase [Candidatus Andersenbacteria bacterium]|nr:phospholipid carrier-dependent glycosyltransferase [Candidatus Andersenbacteria bacterium]
MDTPVPWRAGLLTILFIAALARLWHIDAWPYVLFDEADYATAAVKYLAGQAFVMNHPPLVPLQFAALAWLAGASADQRFPAALLPYGNFPFALMRAATAVAGTLLVLLVSLLARDITGSPAVGLLAGFFAALDNALVIYARLILPDTWLLLYGTAGWWCFFKKDTAADHRGWNTWLSCAGIFFGLAISVKATGLFFPAVAFLYAAWRARTHGRHDISQVAKRVLLVPFLVALTVTLIHWLLLDATGPVVLVGSNTPHYVFTIVRDNNPLLPKHPALARLAQLLAETALSYLYTISGHLAGSQHSAASAWWMWPFMHKPMKLLAHRPAGETASALVVIGNPAVWLGGLAALIFTLWQRYQRRPQLFPGADFLLFSYGLYMAVMAFLPGPMFLYHYFPALILMIILLAAVLVRLPLITTPHRLAFLALVLAGFLYIAPYTYGLSMEVYWTPRLPFIHPPIG